MKFTNYLSATIVLLFLLVNQVFAAEGDPSTTLLPSSSDVNASTEQECTADLYDYKGVELEESFKNGTYVDRDYILGCAIKSGYIKFWMLPYFIKYILEWVINLAGLISILMILVGAYYYIYGGITDDKTKGKNVILYAIGGLILTSIAWFLVNVVLLAITN